MMVLAIFGMVITHDFALHVRLSIEHWSSRGTVSAPGMLVCTFQATLSYSFSIQTIRTLTITQSNDCKWVSSPLKMMCKSHVGYCASGFTEFRSTLSTIRVSISIFYSTFKNAIILIAQSGDYFTCDLATCTLMLQLSKYLYIYIIHYIEPVRYGHNLIIHWRELPTSPTAIYLSSNTFWITRLLLVVLACCLCVGGTGLLLVCWWYWLVAGMLVVLACWLWVGGTGLLLVCMCSWQMLRLLDCQLCESFAGCTRHTIFATLVLVDVPDFQCYGICYGLC